MYSHILVATAFHEDENDARALEAARTLAVSDGRISVLHVREAIPASATTYLPEDFITGLRAEIQGRLDAIAAGLRNATGVLVDGHAGRTIVDWAKKNGVDCIVIASHRPEFQDYLLGSTAGRVVRHADCSVHVLR